VAFGRASARAVLLEPNARAKQAQAVAEPLKKALCVPARCAKLPGRSLEPSSNGRPRGMTVTAATPYRIRLIDPASLVALIIGNDVEGFHHFCRFAPNRRCALDSCHPLRGSRGDGLGALVGLALKVLLQRLPAVIYLLLLF
jgi:hypothetical protein